MSDQNAKPDGLPRLIIPENATLEEIYAICRDNFTAAELQRFTEIEPLVPGDRLRAELEAIHQEETHRRGRKQ